MEAELRHASELRPSSRADQDTAKPAYSFYLAGQGNFIKTYATGISCQSKKNPDIYRPGSMHLMRPLF